MHSDYYKWRSRGKPIYCNFDPTLAQIINEIYNDTKRVIDTLRLNYNLDMD